MPRRFQISVKYGVDAAVALALLIISSPFVFLMALLIKLEGPGRAFYTQTRIGRSGRPFVIYKFRTMVPNADSLLDEQGCVTAVRVTRIGRWLRRSGLDELPQLLNIVRGEMSFIGPRPVLPERHERLCPRQRRRSEMRPGITGLAQISGRNALPWSQRLELDLQYVENYSLWLDIAILLRTVWVVASGSGQSMDRNPEIVDDIPARAVAPDRNEPGDVVRTGCGTKTHLVGHYKKNPEYEAFLRTLNESLSASHDQLMKDLAEQYSTLHVIGAPRSGTTLLTQLLSSCLDVGYINNLIAAFWRAPCYGIYLSEKLLGGARPASYDSDLGRTKAIWEPHEFGYFWSFLLNYEEMAEQPADHDQYIDWQRLRLTLINMTHAFGKPIVFKSFLLAWHLQKVQELLPKSLFVWIRRDPCDNALSLLDARRAQLGSVDKWLSMRPREFEWLRHEPAWTQVAGQVYFIERAISQQLVVAGNQNTICVSYEDMCANPQAIITKVRERLMERNGCISQIASPPERFAIRRTESSSSEYRERVEAAISQFYAAARGDEFSVPSAA